MKKFLVLATLVVASLSLAAANVELTTAQQTAQRFLMSKNANGRLMTSAPQVKWIHVEKNSSRVDLTAYYVVNTDRGFVIVAGDDRAQEVLACGETLIDMNTIPENMKFWLGYYKKQMEFLQAHPGLMVKKNAIKSGNTVAPLLEAAWDQGYPYYSQCPMDGDRRSLTGCATTSLAQVFYKWQYPTQATPVIPGYTTKTRHFELAPLPSVVFDWANILPEYKVGYYNTTQHNAIAQLMRYIGQAEQMDYCNDGSTAWEDDILRACQMFGYVDARIEYKAVMNFDSGVESTYIDDEDWAAMLQDELEAGRPLVFCAYDYNAGYNSYGGHAFNVDGYDAENGLFHINWGWSGQGNGEFALNAFSYQGATYHLGQLAIMGIEPPAPIESYAPVMLPANEDYITLTSFRAEWTDETPAENVSSYTLEVNTDDGSEPGVYEKVFSETFPYASDNGTRPTSKIDNYCTNKGWTGSNVYEARGGLRLGGGGNEGVLTTPAVDMTQSGGKMTVVVTMKPYQSADTDVPVNISCGSSIESVVVNSETTYSIVLKCDADDAQKVTFTAPDGSNTKRIVITQVDIYSATIDAAKMVLTLPAETGDAMSRIITDITDKFYTVRDLTEGGMFNYRVKAFYVNGTQSEWSNMETVTLFDNGPSPHEFEKGDVDHDGHVGIADASEIIDYLLDNSNEICMICADVDGDGSIGIADVSDLIDMLLN